MTNNIEIKENTAIKKESYENLKNTSINLKERFENEGFSDQQLKELGFQEQTNKDNPDTLHGSSYAHFSSFFYYCDKAKPAEITDNRKEVDKKIKKDWDNIDVLQNWDNFGDDKLKAGYVFIGANAGLGAEGLSFEQFENFQNFGSSSIKRYYNSFTTDIESFIKVKKGEEQEISEEYIHVPGKDTKEKKHYEKMKTKEKLESDIKFLEDNIRGSYITDFVKGLPTANSQVLDDLLDGIAGTTEDDDFKKKFANVFVDVLLDELEILGNVTHTLIIMNAGKGGFIKEMLDLGNFEEKYKNKSQIEIRFGRMNHYSSFPPHSKSREQLEIIFNGEKRR